MMKPIGYEAYVERANAVYIFPEDSSFMKRCIRKAEEEGRLFDATAGHKTRSVLIAIKEKVITITLTAVEPDTLRNKIDVTKPHGTKEGMSEDELF